MTTFRVGAATDTGRVRSNNQDSNLVGTNLYAVADGMGGHQGGEVASAIAVETLREAVTEPTADSVVAGVKLANQAIFQRQAGTPELRGMGTTLCAIALVENADDSEELLVVNVGDSRVYRFDGDELAQVTRDHSLVEDLRREGRLTDAEAAVHPHRNVLTRALGIAGDVAVDEFRLPPNAGDRYLLCSDGLFNEVTEDRIAATLRRLADPDDAAHELVRQANENGGRDNVTCVVVDVVDVADGTVPPAPAPRRRTRALEAAVTTGDPGGQPSRAASTARPPTGADLAGFTIPIQAIVDDPTGITGAGGSATPGQTLADTGTGEAGSPAMGATDVGPVEERVKVRKRRRFTWRVLLFAVVFLVVVAVAAVVIVWQGRGTYYVTFNEQSQLVVYQGTPGGILGIDPTLRLTCPGLTTDTVTTTMAVQIRNEKTFTSFPDGHDDALAYVDKVAKLSHASCAITPATSTNTTQPSLTKPTTTLPNVENLGGGGGVRGAHRQPQPGTAPPSTKAVHPLP